MPRERTINIDEPMDLELASILMSRNPRNYVKKYNVKRIKNYIKNIKIK